MKAGRSNCRRRRCWLFEMLKASLTLVHILIRLLMLTIVGEGRQMLLFHAFDWLDDSSYLPVKHLCST